MLIAWAGTSNHRVVARPAAQRPIHEQALPRRLACLRQHVVHTLHQTQEVRPQALQALRPSQLQVLDKVAQDGGVQMECLMSPRTGTAPPRA